MQANSVHYTSCPVCDAPDIQLVLTAEDYTVSHKKFDIWECKNCKLRFTQDVPDVSSIGAYYQSENYISHSDTNKGFINQLYHIARKQTLTRKRKLVSSFSKNVNQSTLLDIGAGTGAFVQHMQQHGWKTTGLEPDEKARERAAEIHHVELLPIEMLQNIPDASCDVITMWHVLEHVHALQDCLRQLKRIIKPSGFVFIAVPNYTSHDAALYQSYWAAYDVPRHLYHFSPTSMQTLLGRHTFKMQDIKPMWFDSFYISMLSEQYKTGRSNIIKAFFNGAISNIKTMFDTQRCSSLIYVSSKS
jgi:2-polyprenyl-3-methyl-5-hydroxy-6-metoxy-1,4-benzoquinol methylase